jgi:hypothetical protein
VTIVVESLVGGYDVNFGARSVTNRVKMLAVQILAEAQIRGDIGKKCVAYFVSLSNIPHAYHAKSWLVHLFINDAGDIDMAKEDPNGKLHYSVSIVTPTQIHDKVISHKEDVIMFFKSTNSSTRRMHRRIESSS